MDNCEKFIYLLYIILNYLCYILAIIFQIKSNIFFSISFHIIQFISSGLTIITLKKTRNKPGYLDKEIEIKTTETKEIKPPIKTEEIAIYESFPIMSFNLMPSNGCKLCEITKLPLRSHHCSKCQKCVECFDHHSWILAGCVGENNRFKFILFLLFQNISLICSSFSTIKIINGQDNEIMAYFLTLLFSVICLIEIIFFWIFAFHIYLLLTNQTTFELFNEDQCQYLAIFTFERNKILNLRGNSVDDSIRYQPFNSGIINNVYLFLKKMVENDYIIDWEKIYFQNLKSSYESKT